MNYPYEIEELTSLIKEDMQSLQKSIFNFNKILKF